MDLLRGRCSSNDRRHDGVSKEPRKRQLQQCTSVVRGVSDERLDTIKVFFGQHFGISLIFRNTRLRRNRLSLAILSREDSALERKVGKEGQALPFTFSEHAFLRLALEQTVFVLHTDKARRPVARSARRSGFVQLISGKIRAADI